MDAYKKHKERETTQLRDESEYLHRWALAMNALVGNVESGAYPAREIGGLRKLTIPARDKPGSLDVEVLKRKADAATRFLETMNLPTASASAGGGGSLRSTGNSVGGLSTAAPGDFDGLETKARVWGCIKIEMKPILTGPLCRYLWGMMPCFAWAAPSVGAKRSPFGCNLAMLR